MVGANPQCSFVEVRHELAADEWNHEERREENDGGPRVMVVFG